MPKFAGKFLLLQEFAYLFFTTALEETKAGRASLTAEIRSVWQAGDDSLVLGHHVHDALLDEVHLVADRSVPDDDVTGEKDLELEFGDDVRDEVVIGVSEKRHSGDQRPTVEIDYLLQATLPYDSRTVTQCPTSDR